MAASPAPAEYPGPWVALVGCGRWGRLILRDLASLGCRVTVVATSEDSRANAVQGGALSVVASVSELPTVAGAVVAVPASLHGQVVSQLLPLGIPVFVEKPLTCDPVEAARLARAGTGRLFVMDKWRYHAGVELLAGLVRSGELGPLLALRTLRLSWGRPHEDVDGIWTLLPHDLAIVQEILGTLPPARAASAARSGKDAIALTAFLGETPSVTLAVSTHAPYRRREVEVQCRDGIALLRDGYCDHVEVWRGGPEQAQAAEPERRPFSGEMPLLRELRCFVEHLGGGPPPRSSPEEGAAAVTRISELRRLAGLDGHP